MSYLNGYDAGYRKGFHDAYVLQQKNPIGGLGVKELFKSLVYPNMYIRSFKEGYEDGYKAGSFLYYQRIGSRQLDNQGGKKQNQYKGGITMARVIKVFVHDRDGYGLAGERVNLYGGDSERTDRNGMVSLVATDSNIAVYVNGHTAYDGDASGCPKIINYEIR